MGGAESGAQPKGGKTMYGLKINKEDKVEIRNNLVRRLDALLNELHSLISGVERMTLRGNCNEIELILVEDFGFTHEQIILMEQKAYRFRRYNAGKYGGYVLTTDVDGKHIWKKGGNVVDPDFRKMDNGIGDGDAISAVREFQEWLRESGITGLAWMTDADIIYPAITEAEAFVLDATK